MATPMNGNPTGPDPPRESVNLAMVSITNPMSQLITIKLEDDNFLLWKFQVENAIFGYGLEGYILGTKQAPARMINNTNGTATINPAFVLYQRQDRLLVSWLLASISTTYLPQLIGCSSSFEIWTTIEQLFNSQSTAKAMYYKQQIQSFKKGSLSMRDYLTKMKGYFDMLGASGHRISDSDQVLAILNGLGDEYESIIAVVCSRDLPYTPQAVHNLLLSHEGRILLRNSNAELQANLANKRPYNNGGNQHTSGYSYNNQNSRGGYNGNRGRGRGRFNNNRPQCQLCGKFGHTVLKCYYRFDQNFSGTNFSSNGTSNNNQNTRQPQSSQRPGDINLVEGQTQSEQESNQTENNQMQAMLAEPAVGFNDGCWYPDSGATNHVTNSLNHLSFGTEYHGNNKIHMGNEAGLNIKHIGQSFLPSNLDSKTLCLKNILHVPSITKNLISVSQFSKDNKVFFEFHPFSCFVKDQATKSILIQGTLHHGLYRFNLTRQLRKPSGQSSNILISENSNKSQSILDSSCNSDTSTFSLWHNRLGHPSSNVVLKVLKDCNISSFCNKNDFFCSSCQLGKSHKLPFPTSKTQYTAPLQLIQSDLWGPCPYISTFGFKYYISFVDVYSRFTWIYFLKTKSEAFSALVQFKNQVENQLNTKIKIFQSDWGGEFRSLGSFFTQHGIIHRLSCPYTSEQNGIVERKHRHIVDTGLTLLGQCSLPFKYWPDAFSTAVYVINRLPTAVLMQKSPLEVLFKQTPDYSQLKTFGCQCFPCLRSYNKHKFAFRSVPCTYLGVSSQHKGFKCLDNNGRVFVSRNVIFNENFFPFSLHKDSSRSNTSNVSTSIPAIPLVHKFQPSITGSIPVNNANSTHSDHISEEHSVSGLTHEM